MVEWFVIFLIATGDPLTAEHRFIAVTEDVCRAANDSLGFLQQIDIKLDGKAVPAQFEYCVWTKDKVIQDYVE